MAKFIQIISCLIFGIVFLIPNAVAAESAKGKTKQGSTKVAPNVPIFISADTLNGNMEKKVFRYKGNVEITRGDMFITSDVVHGSYNKNDQLEVVICEKNVVITRGDSMRASSDRAVYRVPEGIIEMTENPEIAQKGNVLTADTVLIYLDEDRSEAKGNVQVKVLKSNESGDVLEGLKSGLGKDEAEDEAKVTQ